MARGAGWRVALALVLIGVFLLAVLAVLSWTVGW
jgi:hypothetical protein